MQHFPSRVPLNGPWLAVMDTGLPGHVASIRTTSASLQQTETPPGRNEVGHNTRDRSTVWDHEAEGAEGQQVLLPARVL